MKKSISKEILQLIILFLVIIFFCTFYWQTVMYIPLFGDATIHGIYAKEILEGGWKLLTSEYPSLYYFLMDVVFIFYGEIGYNLVIILGLILLFVSTFLFIRQQSNSFYLAMIAVIAVGSSPKIIFYSARMYQEILITGLFVFSFFLLFKYLKYCKTTDLLLLAVFIGIVSSLKQQGLLILYSSITILFFINTLIKKESLAHLLIITLVPILISIPFYGVLYHNNGEILPGGEEFRLIKYINTIGRSVFQFNDVEGKFVNSNLNMTDDIEKAYDLNNSESRLSSKLNIELDKIEKEHRELGFRRAENRHIWPTEVFTDFEKFNNINNLFTNSQGLKFKPEHVMVISFITLLCGLIITISKYKKYGTFLLYSIIFLVINYLLFARNTDQQRYHLFIPIYLLSFNSIFLKEVLPNFRNKRYISILSFCILIIISLITQLVTRTELNKNWISSQIYSSSKGGIVSVKDIGEWLNSKTDRNTLIGQTCGNETQYYSNRKVLGDWRVYFLNDKSLRYYFYQNNISYYVIYKSQIVDDKNWEIVCWVPRKFYSMMENNFKKTYISKANDIYIYEIK
jgi:hypothetical protein